MRSRRYSRVELAQAVHGASIPGMDAMPLSPGAAVGVGPRRSRDAVGRHQPSHPQSLRVHQRMVASGPMFRMGCEPVLDQQPRKAFLRHACHDRGWPGPACSNLVLGELKPIQGIPQQLKVVREIRHHRRRVGLAEEGTQLGSQGGIRQGCVAAVEQRVDALTNEVGGSGNPPVFSGRQKWS